MMAIPSMRERTVKIGSAGKIFSLTGWKVGLVAAAPELMRVLAKAHQFLTFTTPPNLQVAVAYGLGKDEAYFAAMRAGFERQPRSADRRARNPRLQRAAQPGHLFPQCRYRPARRHRRHALLPDARRRRPASRRFRFRPSMRRTTCATSFASASPRPTRRSTQGWRVSALSPSLRKGGSRREASPHRTHGIVRVGDARLRRRQGRQHL